jgi:hypothetical protein
MNEHDICKKIMMDNVISKRVTKSFTQINNAPPSRVFPLLCPVRESDWIDGWQYEMSYSVSGLAELGCIFKTPAPGGKSFTSYVSNYDPANFKIEFVRMASDEMVVKINIQLIDTNNAATKAYITYEYTSMNDTANRWLDEELDKSFYSSMRYWEKAINHYLFTGTKLAK